MKYDIIVLGSGPGGYVAAIRASQLGFKTAVVERSEIGGICLNWGCIPTKALLKSAQALHYAENAADYGFECESPKVDIKRVVERSRGVSAQMSKGVEYLLKKNKITLIKGSATLEKDKVVKVNNSGEITRFTADHIILAVGSRAN